MSRLLVVDDEPEILEMIRIIFRGHEVITASDMLSAVALLEKSPYDLLITDVRMPGASGLDLIGEAARIQPGLPAIVITGHQQETEKPKNVVKWILKPFRTQLLRDAVEQALLKRTSR